MFVSISASVIYIQILFTVRFTFYV